MNKEIIAGYTITDRLAVGEYEFVIGERDTPAEFVTWKCRKGEKDYFWGHYLSNRLSAIEDLCKRAIEEVEHLRSIQQINKEPSKQTKKRYEPERYEENMNDLTRYKLCASLHIPASAKLIYCYLLDTSDRCNHNVIISIKQLGKSVGLSRSATRNNLHRLERMDMIDISPRFTEDGGRLSNRYTLK